MRRPPPTQAIEQCPFPTNERANRAHPKTDITFLSWEMVLMLALASVIQVVEIRLSPFQNLFYNLGMNGRGILRTNPKCIPKVPLDFHLNELIILTTFSQIPRLQQKGYYIP